MVEAAQRRLDQLPEKMRAHRETVEHFYATIKERMGGDPLPDQDAAIVWVLVIFVGRHSL